jgi:hypothetical protein
LDAFIIRSGSGAELLTEGFEASESTNCFKFIDKLKTKVGSMSGKKGAALQKLNSVSIQFVSRQLTMEEAQRRRKSTGKAKLDTSTNDEKPSPISAPLKKSEQNKNSANEERSATLNGESSSKGKFRKQHFL